MIFHSNVFIIFFILVFVAYILLQRSRKWQNALLLVCSYIFYGWVHPYFLLLIFASTVVDYSVGLTMEKRPDRRRGLLISSLIVNLGLLFTFKYFNFFVENLNNSLGYFGLDLWFPFASLILPVGISFYTFQTLSYTIDIYKGKLKPTHSFLDFALFVSFFPQLVAGPIERASNMLPQFAKPRKIPWDRVPSLLLLILWGYFKKLVVSDNLALITDKVFLVDNPSFPILWVGVLSFTFQILADFSGYTDIARGVAGLLGFDLMENFNSPYLSKGPGEFWKRWHISLSTWFRDYVYIPLGGSRVGRWKTARNVMITFLLSGLWHGASWNYVIWGGYWGILIVIENQLRPILSRFHSLPYRILRKVRIPVTFGVAVVGWLFFRETDLTLLVSHLLQDPTKVPTIQYDVAKFLLSSVLLYASPLILYDIGYNYILPKFKMKDVSYASVFRHVAIALLILGIIFLQSPTKSDFIYFQF